jgi:hypothetical protein
MPILSRTSRIAATDLALDAVPERAAEERVLNMAELDRVVAGGSKPGGTGDGVSGSLVRRNP